MKKIIISILFGFFAFSAFAEIKTEPTGEYVGEFQIINIICDSYSEYEERIEYFLENDETFQIVDRFEEECIIHNLQKMHVF